MAIITITTDEASEQQLRDYATNFLNIELAAGDDPRSAIERAEPGVGRIFVLENEPMIAAAEDAKVPDQGAGMQGSLGRGDPRWVINIPIVETEDNSGKNDVFAGVNGRAWQIKRGVDVPVPHRVVVALQNALTTIIRHDDEGNVESRNANRFPFQVIERPSADVIAAWDAKVGDDFCA